MSHLKLVKFVKPAILIPRPKTTWLLYWTVNSMGGHMRGIRELFLAAVLMSSTSSAFALNCVGEFRGKGSNGTFQVIHKTLNVIFEDEDFLKLEGENQDRHFAVTYYKQSHEAFLQIIDLNNSLAGTTAKSFVPKGQSTKTFEIEGNTVYGIICQH